MARSLLTTLAAAVSLLAFTAADSAAVPAAGTTPGGELVIYDTAAPGTIVDRHPITGLVPSETIEGLDVRPVTGELYALGVETVGGSIDSRLYKIDPGTGAATQVGGPGPFSAAFAGGPAGFDFNPSSDRIRAVNTIDQNIRVNPNNGTLVQFDFALDNPADDEGVAAVAYDQNNAGSSFTTLFGYDFANDQIVRIGGWDGMAPDGSPNAGIVRQIGPTGITAPTPSAIGMDITPDGTPFVVSQTAPNASTLYRAALSGAGVPVGTVVAVGTLPEVVEDVAVLQPSSIQLDATNILVEEGAGSATVTVTRSGNPTGTRAVSYATSDGSAGSGDFTGVSGVLTFAPGETSKTFTVPITGDGDDEPTESTTIALSGPTGGATLGNPSTAALTIVDDDLPPAPTTPPPPGDARAPTLLVAGPASRTRRQTLKGITGKISLSEACTGTMRLRLGSTTLGSTTLTSSEPSVKSFRVKPTRKGAATLTARLKRRRTVRLSLVADCKDAANNAGTARSSVTVKR